LQLICHIKDVFLNITEIWDLLVDCTSRNGQQMLDAGVYLSDKRTLLMKTHIPLIVTRFFCKTEILRDFPCTLKAGIFSLKKVFSPFIKKRI
jgi:hypothetical protein